MWCRPAINLAEDAIAQRFAQMHKHQKAQQSIAASAVYLTLRNH